MPAKIYQEKNCIENHAEEILSFGKRALIMTGGHSAQMNGSLRKVQEVIVGGGGSFAVFHEVEENPSVQTIMKAAAFGKSMKVDMVIGIGGGSPMDAAKAAALMLAHPNKKWDYMYEKDADSSRLPLVLIPTTCGTGSEATGVSVLTRHDKGTKGAIPHRIYADLSLIDPGYLKSAPLQLLRNTAIDALAHMYESYLNTTATDYSRMCVDKGLEIWAKSLEVLRGEREAADEDFENMMTASAMAGMAICLTGTTIPHTLSYRLTYNLHMPHGKAVGYFLPGYLAEADPKDAAHLLKLSGFESVKDLAEFYEAVCGREEISGELADQIAEDVLSRTEKIALCPYTLDKEVLHRIIKG